MSSSSLSHPSSKDSRYRTTRRYNYHEWELHRGARSERILEIYRALMRSRWGLTAREILKITTLTNIKTARRYIWYLERSGIPIIIDYSELPESNTPRYRIPLEFKQRELDSIRGEGLKHGRPTTGSV